MNMPPYGDDLKRLGHQHSTLRCSANSPANMRVKVSPGNFYHGSKLIEFVGGNSFIIKAPQNLDYIVLISITIGGEIRISYGQESKNPTQPVIPTNDYPLALIYLNKNSKIITDDSIFDIRPFFRSQFTDHSDLVGRNNNGAHDISAITGLQETLDNTQSQQYNAANPALWGSPVPDTVTSALDNLIERLSTSSLGSVISKLVYVDCSRTDLYQADGSNRKPFKTISDAIAGKTGTYCLFVMPGTYVEDLIISDSIVIMGLGVNLVTIVGTVNTNNCEVGLKDISIEGNLLLFNSYVYVNNFKSNGTITNNGNLIGDNVFINGSGSGSPLIISNGNISLVGVRGYCSSDHPNIQISGGNFSMSSFILTGDQQTNPVIKSTGGVVNLFSGSITNTQGQSSIDLNNNTLANNPNGLFSVSINSGTVVNCHGSHTVVDGVYGGSVVGTNLIFRPAKMISYTPNNITDWSGQVSNTIQGSVDIMMSKFHNLELEQNIFV